uniref:Uncharacterized protein n=1 Tax=Nelumbo nucifera TaxID=4432 RepID=A0A822YEZ3_NELNU|nr:TPA_asm: hypothetical protein HUJ06_029556 [Nelumbo nucifera]
MGLRCHTPSLVRSPPAFPLCFKISSAAVNPGHLVTCYGKGKKKWKRNKIDKMRK